MVAMGESWTKLFNILRNMVHLFFLMKGVETENDYPYKARTSICSID